jgi:hypothetical protein
MRENDGTTTRGFTDRTHREENSEEKVRKE